MWLTLPSFYPVYYIDVWLIQSPYSLWVILLHDLFILNPRVLPSRVMNIKGWLWLQWIWWISVGVWLKPPHNAAICTLCAAPLLWAQWLSGKSIWLVFRRSLVQIPAGPRVFFCGLNSVLATLTVTHQVYWLPQWKNQPASRHYHQIRLRR